MVFNQASVNLALCPGGIAYQFLLRAYHHTDVVR